MLLLQRQEEWCRPKLWCKLDGCANRKKGEKKKKKNDGSRLLSDQLGCLIWFRSYCHSVTVNWTWHKQAMRPNRLFPWSLFPSFLFSLLLMRHKSWWGHWTHKSRKCPYELFCWHRRGMSSQQQDCSQKSEMLPAENDWNYSLRGHPTSRKMCHMLVNTAV